MLLLIALLAASPVSDYRVEKLPPSAHVALTLHGTKSMKLTPHQKAKVARIANSLYSLDAWKDYKKKESERPRKLVKKYATPEEALRAFNDPIPSPEYKRAYARLNKAKSKVMVEIAAFLTPWQRRQLVRRCLARDALASDAELWRVLKLTPEQQASIRDRYKAAKATPPLKITDTSGTGATYDYKPRKLAILKVMADIHSELTASQKKAFAEFDVRVDR